jgi:hypothetical protein
MIMARDRAYGSFEEFFPYYVAMHSKSSTRWIHLAGTLSGAAVALFGVARGRPRWLAAFPGLGYGFAWPSHFLIEHNNPASFGYPLWSFRGDVTMMAMMLSGRDGELGAMARAWLAEQRPPAAGTHPEDAPAPSPDHAAA